MNKKSQLIDRVQQSHAMAQDFVTALSPEARARVGTLEDWSAKDLIAHISAWNERLAVNLRTAAEGKNPTRTEDFDHENANLFAEHHDWSWEAVLAMTNKAHQQLIAQMDALNEADFQSLQVLPWQENRPLWRLIIGTTYIHPVMHLAEHYRNQGARTAAGELIGKMTEAMTALDSSEDWQGVVKYNLACHYALVGEQALAIDTLAAALALRPDLMEWSQQDSDLETLRSEPGYLALYK